MPHNKAVKLAAVAGAVVMAAALSGCSMDGMMGGTPTPNASQLANTSATPAEIAQAAPTALPAIATQCPPIKVLPGAESLYKYAGQVGNPAELRYQAVLDKETRNCVVSNGLISVKMGASGRLMLGPKGSETSVTVPLRFAVERDGMTVFSEKYNLAVAITPPAQAAEFAKVVENVTVPYVGGEDITIWVGFDTRG